MKAGQFTITKEALKLLFQQGFSISQIARDFKVRWNTIKHHSDKWKLVPSQYGNIIIDGNQYKKCPCCKVIKELTSENFLERKTRKDGRQFNLCKCRLCNSKRTFDRHQSFKQKCVAYKGGKCIRCGYNKCYASLDFHHRNPAEKEFQISGIRWKPWETIRQELDKCDCLCRNCHSELHFLENENKFMTSASVQTTFPKDDISQYV